MPAPLMTYTQSGAVGCASGTEPPLCANRELILVCLTNLFTRYPPMPPKANRKRALFVLTKDR